jgi:hypothetical protein
MLADMDRVRQLTVPRRGATVALKCLVVLCLVAVAGCSKQGFPPASGSQPSAGPQRLGSGQCKAGDPLTGVYLPSRLTVKNPCTTVTGTVDCVKHEADGDVHIRLRVDPAYQRLLTSANAAQTCSNQPGPHLVVEIIPQNGHLPLPENSATRGGFQTPQEPPAGAHIRVTGPLVWDSNALHEIVHPGENTKNWAEIHPAWNITVG